MKCICPICNNEFNNLTKHVKMAHHIDKDELLEIYPGTKMISDETSRKISDSLRENWKDSDYAERCSSYWRSEQHARRKSSDMKKLWDDRREEMIQKITESANSDEGRSRRSEVMTEVLNSLWKDEEYLERRRLAGQSQMLKNMKNPSYGHKRYKYKEVSFRSTWEVKVAQVFDLLGIKWSYEPRYFDYRYEGMNRKYIPDFYLDDYDVYIEVKPENMINKLTDVKLNSVKDKGHTILYCVHTDVDYVRALVNSSLS